MLQRATILCVGLLLLVTGCGNSRTAVPGTAPAASKAFRSLLRLRSLGVRLQIPSTWTVFSEQPPLLAVIASGPAVMAVWRFPRAAPVPVGSAELDRARAQLIAAARRRDSTLQVIRSTIIKLNGAQAIELDALERIGGRIRRVRSVHVFASGREIVVEQYAPVDQFSAVDREVFSTVNRSLLVSPL